MAKPKKYAIQSGIYWGGLVAGSCIFILSAFLYINKIWFHTTPHSHLFGISPLFFLAMGTLIAALFFMTLYFYRLNKQNAESLVKSYKKSKRLERRITEVLLALHQGFISTDQRYRIIYINPYAAHMFGLSQSEALDQDMHELLIPDRFQQLHKDSVKEYLETGKSEYINKPIRLLAVNSDGVEFPIEMVISPVQKGKEYIFNIIIRDITELKKLEFNQARLQSITDTAEAAIFSIDAHGVIQNWNPGVEKLYGYTEAEFVGESLELLYPMPLRVQLAHALDQIKAGETVKIDNAKRVHKNGHEVLVSVQMNPIFSKTKKVIGASMIARDISSKLQMEKAKTDFLATISHELEAPLVSMRDTLNMLNSGKIERLSDKSKRLLGMAGEHCERLIRLVNDILDLDKIEYGKISFHMETLSLNKITEESIKSMANTFDDANIKVLLTNKHDCEVKGDHDRLIQAFRHLWLNVMDHVKGMATLQVVIENVNDHARVSVSSKANHAVTYTKINRTDYGLIKKSEGGSKLNVSVAKSIIEGHGGTINFLNKDNTVANFYFELPSLAKNDLVNS